MPVGVWFVAAHARTLLSFTLHSPSLVAFIFHLVDCGLIEQKIENFPVREKWLMMIQPGDRMVAWNSSSFLEKMYILSNLEVE